MLDKILKYAGPIGSIIDSGMGIIDSINNRSFMRDSAMNSISWRVADAKRAGIHPLAALGASTFSPSPIHTGTDFGSMGQQLSQMTKANTMRQKEIDSIENDYKRAQTDYIRMQTKAIENDLSGNGGSNVPQFSNSAPVSGIVGQNSPRLADGVEYVTPQVPVSTSIGNQAGLNPLHLYGVDSDGTLTKVPSQALQEGISEGSLVTQVRYNLGQLSDYVKGYYTYVAPALMSKYKNVLRSERQGIMRYVKPGFEPRYNVLTGQWKIRRIGKEGSQFWDHKKLQNWTKKVGPYKTPKGEHKLWDF